MFAVPVRSLDGNGELTGNRWLSGNTGGRGVLTDASWVAFCLAAMVIGMSGALVVGTRLIASDVLTAVVLPVT